MGEWRLASGARSADNPCIRSGRRVPAYQHGRVVAEARFPRSEASTGQRRGQFRQRAAQALSPDMPAAQPIGNSPCWPLGSSVPEKALHDGTPFARASSMPQLRKDPLSDRWVIYAEGREQRPNEFERVERQAAGRPLSVLCGPRRRYAASHCHVSRLQVPRAPAMATAGRCAWCPTSTRRCWPAGAPISCSAGSMLVVTRWVRTK